MDKKGEIKKGDSIVPNPSFKIPKQLTQMPLPLITPIPEKPPIYTRSLTDIDYSDAMSATSKAQRDIFNLLRTQISNLETESTKIKTQLRNSPKSSSLDLPVLQVNQIIADLKSASKEQQAVLTKTQIRANQQEERIKKVEKEVLALRLELLKLTAKPVEKPSAQEKQKKRASKRKHEKSKKEEKASTSGSKKTKRDKKTDPSLPQVPVQSTTSPSPAKEAEDIITLHAAESDSEDESKSSKSSSSASSPSSSSTDTS
jgi:hypothetical protein